MVLCWYHKVINYPLSLSLCLSISRVRMSYIDKGVISHDTDMCNTVCDKTITYNTFQGRDETWDTVGCDVVFVSTFCWKRPLEPRYLLAGSTRVTYHRTLALLRNTFNGWWCVRRVRSVRSAM